MLKNILSGLRTARPTFLLTFLLAVVLLGQAGSAWAQSAANYAFSTVATGSLALDRNGNAVDMSTGTTQLVAASQDNTASVAATLPFTFVFMGATYTQFSATSNGLIGLGGTIVSSTTYTVSSGTANAPLISAFAGDLSTGPAGKVHYKMVGTSPNRTLVVEFLNMSLLYQSTPTNDGTYQVRLYEGTGVVEYVYGGMTRNSGTSAFNGQQVGIGFAAGSTTGTLAYVLSATNANATTAPFTQQTYATGAIANLNSAANGSRRVYTYVPPTGIPATPGLTATGTTVSSTNLVISDNSTNEGYFKIFQSNDGGFTYPTTVTTQNTSSVATASGNQTAFVVNGLVGSTTYYYRVIAYNESGGVSASFDASVTTAAAVPLCNTKTVGPTGDYASLTAAFAALNGNGLCGPLVFELQSTYVSTVEAFPINYTFTGGTSTNTVTVRPQVAGLSITGLAASTSVFNLSAGKYLILDGRPGGTGTTADLTISGLNTAGNAIQFTADANNNTVQYCQVKGVNSTTTGGVIAFTNTATPGGGGNSSNTITNNKISAGATTPNILIYSLGSATAGAANAGNTVSNNELFDYYNAGTAASAILLSGSGAGGNTGWTISGNSIYQTASRTATSGNTYTGINIGTGAGYTITNNFIGGASASAGSGTFTLAGSFANRFIGIQAAFSTTGTASSIQGNTIRRIAVTSTSGATTAPGVFAGIYVSTGDAAIGTTTGNSIGDASTANSITVSSSTAGGIVYGIHTASSAGAVSISNNTLANVAFTNATGSFYGIQGGTTTATVTNNTIKALSVVSSGTTAATLFGYVNVASPTAETITGNSITGLSIGGTSTSTSHSVVGIRISTIAGDVQVITDNTIGGLAVGTGSGTVQGLLLSTGGAAGTNIARNKIYDLSAVGTGGFAYGISIAGGGTYPVNNNLIGDLRTPASTNLLAIAGLNITSSTRVNAYYNTINLAASSTGVFGTSGIYLGSTTALLDLRNNIVVNKSTGSANGTAVALRLTSATALPNLVATTNNNLYYAGTPAATSLIYVEGAGTQTNPKQLLADYKTYVGTTRETASQTEDVAFVSTTGSASTFLHINPTTPTKVEGGGVAISGITTDFDGDTRTTTPDIGADEGTFTPIQTVDVGVSALTAPTSAQICYTTAETVTVGVRNQNAAALVLAPTTAELTVSGTITSTATGFVTITLPTQTITSGTIAGNGVLAVSFPGTYDLSAPGVYTFNITATVTGDADATNNALPGTANTRTVSAPAAGTATATPAASCGPTTVSLSTAGATGGTVNWYSSADGFVASIGTGTPFVTPSIGATTSYQAKVVCGTTTSAPSNTVTVTVTNPTITATNTPVARCGPGAVTLTATSTSGSTPQYYTAATGGTAFASGASATVSVTGNATYYVGARDNGSATSVAGLPDNSATYGTFAGTSSTDFPLGFNVTAAGTLASVDVYPTVAGTSSIQLYSVSGGNPGAGVAVSGALVSRAFTVAEVGTRVTVPLNFALAAGSYKLSDPANGASFGRFSTYSGTYPITSGPISVVGSFTFATSTSYNNATYNNFFNLTYVVGCEPTARTPIAVNVTTAAALTPATTTQTVCAGTSTTITFAGYPTLTVSPAATAVVTGQDITFSPPATGTTVYTVTGTDGTCSNTATVTLTANPLAAGTASASPGSYCGATSATPTLNLTGVAGQTSFVWQSGPSATGPFTPIAGSTNQSPFVVPAITTTTYYQAVATCGSSSLASAVVAVALNNPSILTTNTPVSRCGPGSVALTATANTGSTISWYDTNASTAVLATGGTYSPSVTASRQYFVGASVGSAEAVGRPAPTVTDGTTPSSYGLVFNATNAFTLASVDVYRFAATSGTITVQLQNSSGTLITGQNATITVPAGTVGTAYTLPLNFAVPAGTGLRLIATAGTASLIRESAVGGFPYNSPSGNVSITSGYISGTTTTYYYFYNWQTNTSCQSARTAVQVDVTPAPALTPATTAQTVCANSANTITFAGYSTLSVSPAATAVVNGQDITFTPAGTTTYTVTGTDGTCSNTATVTLTVTPLVAGSASSSPSSFCGVSSGTPVLTLAGTTGATSGYVWQQSATGLPGSFTDIAGSANTSPFTAPTITATTYYQAVASCGGNNVLSNLVTVSLANPSVVSTTPDSRCGTGTVSLSATPSTGATISWYDTNTSTTVLATGNTYAPTVTATRQFFAVAGVPNASPEAVGMTAPVQSEGSANFGDTGLVFTTTGPLVIQQVTVYNATATAGTLTVNLVNNSTGAIITSLTGLAVNAGSSSSLIPTTLTLNLTVPAAGTYRLVTPTTSVTLYRGVLSNPNFPFNSPSGAVSITGGYFTGSSTRYYNFYNWQVSGQCQSARTAVTATVTPAPALAYTGSTAICNGSSTVLTFSPGSYSTLTVTPTTGTTVDNAAHTITFNPTATTAYTITGNDGTGAAGCSSTATATITVSPVPNAPTITGSTAICSGNSTTVTASSNANIVSTPNQTVLATATFETGNDGFVVSPTNNTTPTTGFARTTGTYLLGTALVSYTGPNSGGSYYVADSDKGATTFTTSLESPSFSTLTYTAATLSFQQYYRDGGSGQTRVQYALNGSSTWVDITTYTTTQGTNNGIQTATTLALPAAALNQGAVKIRFYYTASDEYYWAIDNVGITGTKPVAEQPTFAVTPATGATVSGSNITFNPTATTTYSVTATYPSSAGCPSPATPITITVNTLATWTGAVSTSWFDGGNWNNGCVPNRNIDASIPTGLTTYPALTTTATAEVRTLTIAGGASLGQSAGILNVYGDLSNSGTADLTGGTVALLGTSPLVTGLSAFYGLEVNLASGTVLLSNATSISNRLTMTQGVLNTNSYTLTLLTGSTLSETDNSYLLGTVSVPDRTLTAGTAESFSGIGLVLTPAAGSNSPGPTPVVRTTGTALTGAGTSVSIKRYFDIQPATNTGLNVTMDFSYLNHELNGIPSGNLALFKSVTTTAGPWANQSPISAAGNTITKTGIADFSIWTLGNAANPLPVELTAFSADRQGSNAALAWTTASEKNSRGFEVQVSADGRSYRVLGFVASATPSSTAPRQYAYLDREAGKTGARYYRLRQLDFDGTATFSPVRTLRFDGETAQSFTAAPNPFREQLTLTVVLPADVVAAPGQLTLTDAAGRTLLQQRTPALPAGQSQLELADLAKLASGVYIVHLAVPGQPTQHLKVVKE